MFNILKLTYLIVISHQKFFKKKARLLKKNNPAFLVNLQITLKIEAYSKSNLSLSKGSRRHKEIISR